MEFGYIGVASVLMVVGRMYRLDDPITSGGWAFRFTQTAFGIRSMLRGGVNPFTAEVPVLGPPWRIPYEFPVFQMFGAVLGRLFSLDAAAAGRLAALISHSIAGLAVYLVACAWWSRRAAAVSWVVLMCSAYGFNWGAEVLMEYFSVGFCMLGLWSFARVLERRSPTLATLAVVFGAIGALAKITTAVAWVLTAGLVVAWPRRAERRARVITAVWLAATLLPATAWNRLADDIKGANPHTQWLTSGRLNDHHFGHVRDPRQLLDAGVWRAFIEHSAEATVGSILVAVVLVLVAVLAPWSAPMGRRVAIIAIVPLFVFTRLYLGHDYYLIALSPALAILAGAGIETIRQRIATTWSTATSRVATIVGALVVVGMSWVSPEGVENLNNSLPGSALVAPRYDEVTGTTRPDDHLLVVGMDWSPVFLYTVDRKGLMLRPAGTRPADSELGTFYGYVYWAEPNPTPEQWAEYFPRRLRYSAISPNFYRIFPLAD